MSRRPSYGVLAAFTEPEPAVAAAKDLRAKGFARLEAFTPYPVPDLEDPVGADASVIPWIVVVGGLVGALAAYGLILYSVGIDYPINAGGRPINAWPAYLVLAFEGGVLGAALGGFFGMIVTNGLPAYYHPVFNAESFSFAGDDRFYILVVVEDATFDANAARRALSRARPVTIEDVRP